jgi:myosin heavy subunit
MATLSSSSSTLSMQNVNLDLATISPLLQNQIELWTTRIQYNHLLQTMSTNVTDVWKVQKEQSVQTRKALSDNTKVFKKSVKNVESAILQLHSNDAAASPQDGSIVSNAVKNQIITCMEYLSQECRSTIKLYQEEIDTLTRRCKTVEQEYSSFYSQIVNASDPAILYCHSYDVIVAQSQQLTQLLLTVDSLTQELEQSEKMCSELKEALNRLEEAQLQKTSISLSNEERDELKILRKEVAEYEVEFRSLKNQDITIRKLEEKIKELQISGEESIRTSIEQATQEIAYNEGRRLTDALERESALIAKVQTLELQLKSERVGREMTQNNLLIADDRVSNQEAVWEVQKNILMDDNVRVREALQTITRERDELLQELDVFKSSRDTAKRTPPVSIGVSTGGSSGAVVSFQDLLLERNAYEAEVRVSSFLFLKTKTSKILTVNLPIIFFPYM